ncbi:hypothetical protein M9H77_01587 [Catharanthus roseus]|uniref:Uncharacterized protein n=1 Tax=Catharanthus roseus TaxID=4058 RepID=A0ACC0C5Y8_CATRO|nr:hypothetical protein M9H77_01587 [Catharanthus roseus]
MDRLVKPEFQELYLAFNRGKKCSATFQLTNLMHTMSVAISLTTTNPSIFSFSNPFSVIPPLSTSSFTLSLSHHPLTHPPFSSPLDTILVRSSMLPTGKAHQDDLRRLFSKPGPHIFKDATIPIVFVGPHAVESLILSPKSPKSLEIAFLLSKAIDWCDKSQLNSLLKTAAMVGNYCFVSSLIDAGADVNSRDKNGQSAMSMAVRSGNLETVQTLIELGYVIDHSIDRFLHESASMNRLDLIKILYLGYPDIDLNSIDSQGKTPLHLAATAANHGRKNLEILEFLVSNGSHVDVVDNKGWTPLHYAAQEGFLEGVEFLLEFSTFAKFVRTAAGEDEEEELGQKTPYDLAEEKGYSELYDVLYLSDVLHRSAGLDDVQEIKNCISKGANVNSRDQNGWTPLHRAAFKGRIESSKILISNGAEIDLVDDIGYTPLHLAAESGHVQVALFLIAHGAKSNMKTLEKVVSQDLDCFKNQPSLVKKFYQLEKEVA